jgi:nitrite reductase/ring-hydroxylating ferredoxin subunit
MDPSARLEMYTVSVKDGAVYLCFPELAEKPEAPSASQTEAVAEPAMKENEFLVSQVKPGEVKLVFLNGRKIAVYNIEGAFYATQEECTHASGPLSKGDLDGKVITCPWHDSCFDVTDGSVVCGPAEQPLKTFSVTMHGEIGRVEIKA